MLADLRTDVDALIENGGGNGGDGNGGEGGEGNGGGDNSETVNTLVSDVEQLQMDLMAA